MVGLQKNLRFDPSYLVNQSFALAKLPIQLINAIETLTQCWYTKVTLNSESETLTTNIIKFLKGIFQGDSLSVSLFVICLNPLPFLLKRVKGYTLGQRRSIHHTHNFFVDDLKRPFQPG